MLIFAIAQSSGIAPLVVQAFPIIAIVAIFYFLVIAPANKQRRQTEEMLGALKKGDRVLTSGGVYGTVQGIEGNVVHLRIAENVKIKVSKAAVTSVVTEAE